MPERRVAAISDLHVPYHHRDLLSWALRDVIEPFKPTHMVINGDLLDLNSISRFGSHVTDPLEEEIMLGGEVLEEIREVLPKTCERWLLWGNHEERLLREDGEIPPSVQSMLCSWERFHEEYGLWEQLPYEQEPEAILRIGPYAFLHGFKTTKTSDDLEARVVANMLETDNLVVIRGHTHRVVHVDKVRNHRHLWRCNLGTFMNRKHVKYTTKIDTSTWEPGVFLGTVIEEDGVQKYDCRVVQPLKTFRS